MCELERQVERAIHLVDVLPTPELRAEAAQRVRAALQAEASRWRQRARLATYWRWGGSVAAAVALAVGLRATGSPWVRQVIEPRAHGGSQAAFDSWVAAMEESRRMLDESWVLDLGSASDSNQELDDVMDSLERTLRLGT